MSEHQNFENQPDADLIDNTRDPANEGQGTAPDSIDNAGEGDDGFGSSGDVIAVDGEVLK